MSSRRRGALALFVASLLGTATLLALAEGCSEEPATTPTDAGTDEEAPKGTRPAPPEPDAGTTKTCQQECADMYPAAVAKDEAINECWETHCRAPCVELKADAGVTDGAAPDGATCSSPVITPSLSCDECTQTLCCPAWDTCFQDSECADLNACYQRCTD